MDNKEQNKLTPIEPQAEEQNEAVLFAEYTHINGWKFDSKLKKWVNYYGQTMNETTQELFTQFKLKNK